MVGLGTGDAVVDPLPTIAVIDIGSNTIRMVEYEVIGGSGLRVVRAAKEVPRLGHGLDPDGGLTREALEEGARAVRRLVTGLPPSRHRRTIAVATSAVRDATNRAAFVARVAAVASVRPRVLSGAQEARYGKQGVAQAWRLRQDVVVDLGGGSMQVVYVRRGEVAESFSLPLGTVRAHGPVPGPRSSPGTGGGRSPRSGGTGARATAEGAGARPGLPRGRDRPGPGPGLDRAHRVPASVDPRLPAQIEGPEGALVGAPLHARRSPPGGPRSAIGPGPT